ncbi:MAG: 3-hydroxybutyrate dehydrogenase [Gammaproteobacteria bacterium]|nr:3-hydroxybutyrate dehydrogenase [Gammaproteobacteria bacterium]
MSDQKTAVITGSTSGIGLGIANGLATTGMNIVLNGIESAEEIEPLRSDMEKGHGIKVIYSAANLMESSGATELIRVATDAFSSVDVLVNNAGIQHVAPIDEFPDKKWEAIVALNLSACFYTSKAVLPGMKAQNWGRIVNIVSAHGLVASPFKSAYVAAKHGLIGFTKSAALEVAESGITVNAICPGYVRTPLVEKQIPDTARARGMTEEQVINDVILAAHPNNKFVTIEEIAALTVFLASDDSASITGASLPVDGGWTAR